MFNQFITKLVNNSSLKAKKTANEIEEKLLMCSYILAVVGLLTGLLLMFGVYNTGFIIVYGFLFALDVVSIYIVSALSTSLMYPN